MGNDQHGPAYPEPPQYRCPICHGNDSCYLECEYPGCPDGRDRGHPHARQYFPVIERTSAPIKKRTDYGFMITTFAVALAVFLYLLWPHAAPAMDHGFNPNSATTKWMESLQRPNMPGSCCGKGDGYPVSEYWDNHNGTWTAKIGDGSGITYPDGTTRNYFPTGGEVIVDAVLVNPEIDDLDNPTDTSWIFMTVHAAEVGTVYCLIRHPSGN